MKFREPPTEGKWYPNFCLYGPPKSGKSLGAASAPGSILYLNADTENSLYLAHKFYPGKIQEAEVEGLQTLIEATNLVKAQTASGNREIETVVLDPVGDIYRKVIESASNKAIRPTLNQYGDTGVYLERFCRDMCAQPVNFVIVAHEFPQADETTGEVDRLLWTGTKSGSQAMTQKILGMVDVVGYTALLIDEASGKKQYVAQLVTDKGRKGGDRFGVLGNWQPLNLASWIDQMRTMKPENLIEAEGAKPKETAKKASAKPAAKGAAK
jgi:hypothetical protein